MSDDDVTASDAALFARLRAVWTDVDPVPADLVDRMVAAVAVADLSREYEMLTLVETVGVGAVRSETDTLTLQFSDGEVSVLVHVSAEEGGTRRIDGWVDATPLAVTLAQDGREVPAEIGEHGRFAVTGVRAGLSSIRMVVRTGAEAPGADAAAMRDFRTPQFEV